MNTEQNQQVEKTVYQNLKKILSFHNINCYSTSDLFDYDTDEKFNLMKNYLISKTNKNYSKLIDYDRFEGIDFVIEREGRKKTVAFRSQKKPLNQASLLVRYGRYNTDFQQVNRFTSDLEKTTDLICYTVITEDQIISIFLNRIKFYNYCQLLVQGDDEQIIIENLKKINSDIIYKTEKNGYCNLQLSHNNLQIRQLKYKFNSKTDNDYNQGLFYNFETLISFTIDELIELDSFKKKIVAHLK